MQLVSYNQSANCTPSSTMENGRVFLLACLAVFIISFVADLLTVDAKFSLSNLKGEIFTGLKNLPSASLNRRSLEESNPCARYGDGHNLPAGHPCAFQFERSGVISRLVGTLKKGIAAGGRHPPSSGGHHPPGTGKLPPGIGHHGLGVGHHPPRAAGDPRCRHNVSLCLDANRNTFLATDPTATTCCRTKCVSLVYGNKNCGACGKRCRKSTGGPDCCKSTCTDVLTDNNNCGTCGTVCSASESCTAGKCLPYV